jgi:excisionase family DNA binding protein
MAQRTIDRELGPRKAPAALMKAREAADYLSMSEEWVRQRGRDGTLPTVKLGAAIRFRRSALDKWLDSQAVAS